MFKGKTILFISPSFFKYEIEIRLKLEALGAYVEFYDERPSNASFVKALLRIDKRVLNKKINRYYKEIFEKIRGRYFDFVFVLKGEATPTCFLSKLRGSLPASKFIYYSYDSLKNNKNAVGNFKYFDSTFSFDKEDTYKVPGLRFRPLFFLDKFSIHRSESLKYDISFIGTAHSDRYEFIQKLVKRLNDQTGTYFNNYLFFYCQSKWFYYYKKLMDRNFRNVKEKDVSFLPMSIENIFEVFQQSKCVVDVHHPAQTGLTMRTIEALGAGKKIITTNSEVAKYDFYNKQNILIVDRNIPEVNSDFLTSPYATVNDSIYLRYSLKCFLEDIFFG